MQLYIQQHQHQHNSGNNEINTLFKYCSAGPKHPARRHNEKQQRYAKKILSQYKGCLVLALCSLVSLFKIKGNSLEV